MTVDGDTFRTVLAQWPTGVAVVTTVADDGGADGGWHGMTASSFTSVSLNPPLVLVCLNRELRTHTLVQEAGRFAVSVLGRDQADLGRRFAGRPAAERFTDPGWRTAATGAPVLDTALGWVDCRVVHAYPGGDHTIFVGEVVAADTPRRTPPLLFHSRTWGQLADPLPQRISVADTGLAAVIGRLPGRDGLLAAVRDAGVRTRIAAADPPPAGPYSRLVADPRELPPGQGPLPEAVEFSWDSAGRARELVAAAHGIGAHVVGRVPDAFADGARAGVLHRVTALAEAGCDEVALDEGPEPASPLRLRELLRDATTIVPLRIRLGHGDGLGLANTLTALKSGVSSFDVTLGGLDGGLCATEVLGLAERLDIATPADREALRSAVADLHTALRTGPHLGRTTP